MPQGTVPDIQLANWQLLRIEIKAGGKVDRLGFSPDFRGFVRPRNFFWSSSYWGTTLVWGKLGNFSPSHGTVYFQSSDNIISDKSGIVVGENVNFSMACI